MVDVTLLDWDRVRIFRVVAETGSINAAAGQLRVSPAKVARDLDELEYRLGVELLARGPTGVELTNAGAVVLKSARNMHDSANALSTGVAGLKTQPASKVVIATHDAMATYWLARHLAAFHRAHPGTEVVIRVVQETPNLAAGDGDISIQFEPPAGPNIFASQLGWLHYILYASPAYLAIHGVPKTMFDLGQHRFLLLAGYNKQTELWDPKTPAWFEVIDRSLLSNSSTVILESCASDGGVAPMPTYVSEFERRVTPLTQIKPLASIRFWMTYVERIRNPIYEPVLEWLRDCFDHDKHPCFRETYVPPVALA
jgi:DNA-binding transcriptional LysR family regulator